MNFPTKAIRLSLLCTISSICLVFSQTTEERQNIKATYETNLLNQLTTNFLQKAEENKAAAVVHARMRNIPIQLTLQDGGYAELQSVLDDGTLIYYRTLNVDAARSTRTNHLNIGGSLGLNLDGQNMIAGVWDGGHARVTHQEYDGPGGTDRVTIMDGPVNENFHAAHVAGTIMASGVISPAKGMAPRSRVNAFDWNNDLSEASTAAGNGLLLSNHSYGFRTDLVPDNYFGGYITVSRDWDALQYNAPYYLMVVAAGNDGTTNYNGAPLNPGLPQYDKLTGHTVSKNTMVVASAQDANVNSNGDLISVDISYFSSQGPTDDLRIKPDITGNGHGVFSTFQGSDTDYFSISGTSMASPNVTGSLLLLQEHANNVNGNFMRAATLKGLALHTADDAGMTGPDAIYGWGLLNAKSAAETITENGSSTLVQELTLSQGQTFTVTVEADGYNDLMASISWTDPAGTATSEINNATPRLVNDLDIRITKNSDSYYPWRLTGVNTNSNDGDNFRDPFERVDVTGATGNYTITVTHKGSLSGGSQNFSLVVTGIQVDCTLATVPVNVEATGVTGTTASLNWNPVPGALYDVRFRESGTTIWTLVEDIPQANTTLTALTLLTQYEVQVRSKCPGGTPSDFTLTQNFTTSGPTYCVSASQNSLAVYHISNVSLNAINNNSIQSAYTDFTNISTTLEPGQTYTVSITPTTDNPIYGVYFSVWIDYNLNGNFGDAGEQVFTFSGNAQNPASGQFTVPVGILPGNTRMRISLSNSGIPGPCDSFSHGEVEDYTIFINPEGYIFQDGTWLPVDPSGVSTAADNITIVNGATFLSEATEANNLYILPGASLSIAHTLKVNGDITNDGELIFVSNANNTGQLDTFTGTVNGDVTIERYIPARRAYRFLSSAVNTTATINANWQEGATQATDNPNPGFGTHITGSSTGENGFDATPSGNPSLFTLNNADQVWEALENTNINTITAGTAYRLFVRGDRSIDVTNNSVSPTHTTLRTRGTLHTGTFVANDLSSLENEFNFFGNPYPAAVDMNAVLGASTNVNPAHYYIWDPNLGTRGAYVTIELPAGTNSLGSAGNQYLQPGQAAFVTTQVNGAASLTFEEAHKNVNADVTAVFSTATNMDIRLYRGDAFTAGETPSDGLRLKFGEDQSNAITSMDAPKFYNQDENLASSNAELLWSIESRALPLPGESIPLYTNQYRTTDYVFEVELTEFTDLTAVLRDYYTGIDTELISNDITFYAFSVDPADSNSIADDRFEIVFEELLSTTEIVFGNEFVLFPNPANDQFTIATKGISGDNVTVSITNVLGQTQYNKSHTVDGNGQLSINATALKQGVYIVNLIHSNGGKFTTKLIIK